MRRKKSNVIIILLVILGVLLPCSQALGGGLLSGLGKAIQYYAKASVKEKEYKQKEYQREIAKQQKEWDKQMQDELKGKLNKSPLELEYLQKIDVYKKEISKIKSKQDLIKIIDHIKKYGEEKYGDNLSQKHKELLKELEDQLKKWDEVAVGSAVRNISGMAILAFMLTALRIIVLKF